MKKIYLKIDFNGVASVYITQDTFDEINNKEMIEGLIKLTIDYAMKEFDEYLKNKE